MWPGKWEGGGLITWHWLIAKVPESLTCCPAPHGGWEASGRSRVTPAYTPGRRRRGKRAGRKAGRAAPQRRTGTDVSPGRGAAACVVVPGPETRGARLVGGFPQLQPGWAKVLEGKSTVNKLYGSAEKGGGRHCIWSACTAWAGLNISEDSVNNYRWEYDLFQEPS